MNTRHEHPAGPSGSTVTVLPETGGDTLCVRLTGLIRKEDHRQNLYGKLDILVKENGTYNLLIDYAPDYVGWEPEAADISLRSIMEFGRQARRIAYVNPPEKKVLQNKLTAPLFGGEVRFFDAVDFDEALRWVREG